MTILYTGLDRPISLTLDGGNLDPAHRDLVRMLTPIFSGIEAQVFDSGIHQICPPVLRGATSTDLLLLLVLDNGTGLVTGMNHQQPLNLANPFYVVQSLNTQTGERLVSGLLKYEPESSRTPDQPEIRQTTPQQEICTNSPNNTSIFT